MNEGHNEMAVEEKTKGQASGTAIASLILGIISVICMCSCILTVVGIFSGVPAIILGRLEMKNIRQGRSSSQGRSIATAGLILGIIGTAISFLALLIYLSIIIFGISTDIWESVRT